MRLLLLVLLLCLVPLQVGAEESGPDLRRYLNIRAAYGGDAAPRGGPVAFISNITGVGQVWRVDAPGGWPTQLTFEEDRVHFVRFSPDGRWIAFGRDAGGNEFQQIYLMPADGGVPRPLTNNPKFIHHFGGFSPDGKRIAYASNERDGRNFDVFVADLATGTRKEVYRGTGSIEIPAWSPDGKKLVLERWNTNVDSDLLVVDLGTGEAKHLTPHEGTATYSDVHWPAPGDALYLVSDFKREFRGLARLDVASGKLTFLEGDRNDVDDLEVDPQGRFLVVAHNVDGYSRMSLRSTAPSSASLEVKLPGGVIEDLSLTRGGDRLTFTLSTPSSPANVWMVPIEAGGRAGASTMVSPSPVVEVTRSTLAGVPAASFVTPSLVSYPTFDGRKTPGFLYMPAGAASPVPAIVWMHGGPESQYRPAFSGLIQYFVRRGYAVFAPNVRGSSGYGVSYLHMDNVEKRFDSIQDMEYANRYLAGLGSIDPRRIAVMGGSYGGYMTLAALTFQPERWAAGVDIVGISNLKTFLKNTGAYRQALRISEYGHPDRDAAFLEKVSPFYHVDKIKAPLLVIQGANDPRVPQSEADQIVEKLKSMGRPVTYLLFADEGHGLAKLHNRIKAYTEAVDFLDRAMK